MKKCLHILPMNKLSGAEKMALLICKNMKGYEPIVVCGGEVLKNIFEKNGIKSCSLRFSNGNIMTSVIGLRKIIKENNIRFIHAHDNTASMIAFLTKKIFGLEVVVISHVHSCYPWLKTQVLKKRMDSIIRPRYDYNILCGNTVYGFYKENSTYLEDKKVAVLSNSIDLDDIDRFDLKDSEMIRKKYNIPKDKIILGFVGRLCEIKGLVPFIKELSNEKEAFLDSRVLLIGSGDQELEIKELIKKLGMENIFILTGFQEHVNKFYPLIDIFFLPSLYEGLPMVILEAMAFKKTVVSMDVGGIGELINENNGILVKEGDYREFVTKLKKLKQDYNNLNKYGDNSYTFVKENYNIKNYINTIENHYGILDKTC